MNNTSSAPTTSSTTKTFSELFKNLNTLAHPKQQQIKNKGIDLIYSLSTKVKDLTSYYLYRDQEIDFSFAEYEKYISFLQENPDTPIERLSNKAKFRSLELVVENNVFIPRWETECIVDLVVQYVNVFNLKEIKYIDICSGTGAIGLATHLALKELVVEVNLLDLSPDACQNIDKNLKLLAGQDFCPDLKQSTRVINADWSEELTKNEYNLITANFPYIGHSDPYDPLINEFEPKLALFADNDGWDHYQRLLDILTKKVSNWQEAKKIGDPGHIRVKKLLVLECNELHLDRWEKIAIEWKDSEIYKIYLHKDLNNKFRFVVIYLEI